MAYSNNSIITGKLRGGIGKELVFRDWDGKTVVSKAPAARGKKATGKQKAMNERFMLASTYAKNILKDEDMKEAYQALVKPRQNVYSRAMEDFLSSPVITSVNTQKYKGDIGDVITVRAYDDFRITEIIVEIRDNNGTILEEGTAIIQPSGLSWSYITKIFNSALSGCLVRAVAMDVPGNESVMEVRL